MTLAQLLWWCSVGMAAASLALYLVGLWRRWRPGPNGRPAWSSEPGLFREPWTAASFGLVLVAILLQAAARLV